MKDNFKELTGEQVAELTAEKQIEYFNDLNKHRADKMNELKVQMKKEATEAVKAEIEELTAEINESNLKQIKSINDALEAQGLAITKLMHKGSGSVKQGYKSEVNKAFDREGLQSELAKIISEGSGMVEILKAVGPVTTGNVSTTSGGNALLDLINADELEALRMATSWIEDYATVTRTSKPVYTYANYEPKDGDADFVAEGGTKPAVDLKVTVVPLTPYKAAAHEILTEEAATDVPRMQSESSELIFRRVMLKRQNGILFGDGIAPNPPGVSTIAKLFNAATWPNKQPADSTNLKDWVIGAANQIQVAENYTDDIDYNANVAFVNPSDYNELLVTKAVTGGLYQFATLQLGNENGMLGTVVIIAKKQIPQGQLLIGDFTKLRIVNYIDYMVKAGYINDQLITNMFTLVGENRFYTFVKTLDEVAFVYDSFANVKLGMEVV